MLLIDTNVLVYAFRYDSADHEAYRSWLAKALGSEQACGLAGIVAAGFVRIVSHSRIYKDPTAVDAALRFLESIADEPNCIWVAPGPRHWEIFARLCRDAKAGGDLIPNAYLAAMAIENGAELITTDRDFARFRGLRWRHPLR